ncbi:threonine/homoserine efflux transporter [Bifidobacterium saguini DSM 23967]|uniref:EamA family transporter n=3 Tax=Bifidobacterium TaxID=1678 RepID=A0A2N5IT44_9BIFI|nr:MULTISPECIES: EamA family transporter [Bifidobacterium]KFI92639.1 threonine/homoserine efflux transporter [Bifidobacterium saguini DSM 23967]PLS25107.1 threonine transporter RhtB [Bifidobacterium imperatoris]QSY56774.1 EamA family transporter [Bifidobacterium imperatoris]QTB91651.1 EamA family transporter [Bifidobacterium saguini]
MKKAVVSILNRVPVVLIVIGEALVIYTATAIAKLAFTQLDPLYSVWYRVGFMTLLLLAWRRPWQRAKRDRLFRRSARSWGLVALLGCALVLMNTMFYVAISNMDMGIAVSIEFIGPLSVAVITGRSWRERLGIGIAAIGVVLLAGISLSNPASNGSFLIGLIAILIGGSMWGVYIVTGRRVAAGGNSLDNLCIAVTIGWIVQSLFLGVPAVEHVIWPKSDATWALEPGGSLKLLALLFVISLMASFIPYVVEQITLRRTTSGAFSVMQSINPAVAVAVGLAFGEIPGIGELVGVGLVIFAVIVTFSGDAAPAQGK